MRQILAKMAPFASTNIHPLTVNVKLVGRDRHVSKVSKRDFYLVTFVVMIE